MNLAHTLLLRDEGKVTEWVKIPSIRNAPSILATNGSRRFASSMRVRRAKSCNQSLHDTKVNDGGEEYEVFCLTARELSLMCLIGSTTPL